MFKFIKKNIGNGLEKIRTKSSPAQQKSVYKQALFSTIYRIHNDTSLWSDRDYEQFAENGYRHNVIAYYATNLVAKSISSIPVILVRYNKNGEKRKVMQHIILDLMKKPNPFLSGTHMMERIAMHLMLSGNAYVLKIRDRSGIVKELHVLRPDKIVIATKNERIVSYKYVSNNTEREYKVEPITGKCDVMHIKNFHPTNDIYGLSMFEAASYSIDQHNQASAWTQSLLKNSARPSGALVVKGEGGSNLTEEQYNKLKDQMDEFFSGSQNSGRPILLEGGLEWKEMSLKPKDMDFVEAKYAMSRDIALSFGVPSYLLGIPGDNTYSNLSEAKTMLWEQTVLPMLNNILNYFSNWLANDFSDSTLSLECDSEHTNFLAKKRGKKTNEKKNEIK